MIELAANAFRDRLSDTLNRVAYAGERYLLTRHGKSVAALVSVEDWELLRELEDRADLAAVRKAMKEPGASSWESVKAELGIA